MTKKLDRSTRKLALTQQTVEIQTKAREKKYDAKLAQKKTKTDIAQLKLNYNLAQIAPKLEKYAKVLSPKITLLSLTNTNSITGEPIIDPAKFDELENKIKEALDNPDRRTTAYRFLETDYRLSQFFQNRWNNAKSQVEFNEILNVFSEPVPAPAREEVPARTH